MDEQDVRRIMAHGLAMIGSDGLPHDAYPHPRLWGTFPRVLGHYARDLGLFSLEAAVRKMTGHTAEVFGLVDRGVIRAGAFADLVLFDPATVCDAATFDAPTKPAEGIVETWVNGRSAYVHRDWCTAERAAGRLVTRALSHEAGEGREAIASRVRVIGSGLLLRAARSLARSHSLSRSRGRG